MVVEITIGVRIAVLVVPGHGAGHVELVAGHVGHVAFGQGVCENCWPHRLATPKYCRS